MSSARAPAPGGPDAARLAAYFNCTVGRERRRCSVLGPVRVALMGPVDA